MSHQVSWPTIFYPLLHLECVCSYVGRTKRVYSINPMALRFWVHDNTLWMGMFLETLTLCYILRVSCNLKAYNTTVLCRYKHKSVTERTHGCSSVFHKAFCLHEYSKAPISPYHFLHYLWFYILFIRTGPDAHENGVTSEKILCFPNFVFLKFTLHFPIVTMKICLILHFIVCFAESLLAVRDDAKSWMWQIEVWSENGLWRGTPSNISFTSAGTKCLHGYGSFWMDDNGFDGKGRQMWML
jgi:hypothetical protein